MAKRRARGREEPGLSEKRGGWPAGSRSAPGVYTLSFRHGIKFQAALEAPGAGHRPGRGEELERDRRQRCADQKARRAWAQLVPRSPQGRGEGKSGGQGGQGQGGLRRAIRREKYLRVARVVCFAHSGRRTKPW